MSDFRISMLDTTTARHNSDRRERENENRVPTKKMKLEEKKTKHTQQLCAFSINSINSKSITHTITHAKIGCSLSTPILKQQ